MAQLCSGRGHKPKSSPVLGRHSDWTELPGSGRICLNIILGWLQLSPIQTLPPHCNTLLSHLTAILYSPTSPTSLHTAALQATHLTASCIIPLQAAARWEQSPIRSADTLHYSPAPSNYNAVHRSLEFSLKGAIHKY